MLKEIFKKTVFIDAIDFNLGTVKWQTKLTTDKENLHANALEDLFSTAGDFEIKKDEKIFFFEGSTVPRFKVRQLCQKEGMAIVRSPDKATVVVVGDETHIALVRDLHCYNVGDKDEMLQILVMAKKSTQLIMLAEELTKAEIADEVIFNNWSPRQACEEFIKSHYTLSFTNTSDQFWVADEGNLDAFEKVMEDGIRLVTQSSLLRFVNTRTVMTKDMYGELDKMFSSSDKANHVLAMELMANCDYEKSALPLLRLLSDNANKISKYKEKSHVNFLSLCKFFDMSEPTSYSLDKIIQVLTSKQLLSSEVKKDVMAMALEKLDLDTNSKYFRAVIVPSDDLEIEIEEADKYMKSREALDLQPTLDITSEEDQTHKNQFEL